MANIFRTISTKFYQNRPGFVDDLTKNIWCVFGFAVPIVAYSLTKRKLKFHNIV